MLADAPREAGHLVHQIGIAAQTADDFDQPHQRRRIEEMQARHPRRIGAAGGDFGDRQRGGVGQQHGVRRDALFQFAKQFALGFEIFDNGLDDDAGGRRLIKRLDRPQAIEHAVLCVLGHTAFRHLAVERLADCCNRFADRAVTRIEHQRREAGVRADLRDAAPHGAGAEHSDRQIWMRQVPRHVYLPSNVGFRFSRKARMPSFWSLVANCNWNALRSSINAVSSGAFSPALTISLTC